MIRLFLSLALVAGAAVPAAHADQFICLPSQLGGQGTRAVWGMTPSVPEFWAGWWCGDKHQLAACTGAGCSQALLSGLVPQFEQAPKRTVKGANNLLNALATNDLNDPVLRAVWMPHWPEIAAAKPATKPNK